jgi:CreA protein
LDRLRQGNWFENPSNSADLVPAHRARSTSAGVRSTSRSGEEVFNQRQSLFFKNVAVRRIIDLENSSIIYVSHSREIVEGSAKIDLSSVALTPQEVAAAQR